MALLLDFNKLQISHPDRQKRSNTSSATTMTAPQARSEKEKEAATYRNRRPNTPAHNNVSKQIELTMKPAVSFVLLLLSALASGTSASVFLPKTMEVKTGARTFHPSSSVASSKNDFRWTLRQRRASKSTAMAIPGYGIAEQVFVGGFANFLSIVSITCNFLLKPSSKQYNIVITARILLSWFPQAQGIGLLQPVYAITDPYLNLFRGLIPPIFGLDLSPILAFFLLSTLGNATAAVGCEIPPSTQQKFNNRPNALFRRTVAKFRRSTNDSSHPSMNY